MATVDLTRFIIPVELDNTDENQKMGNRSFKTKDYVFLDSDDDIKDLNSKERQTTATDYAVMNGALLRNKDTSFTWYWLRSAYSENSVHSVHMTAAATVNMQTTLMAVRVLLYTLIFHL